MLKTGNDKAVISFSGYNQPPQIFVPLNFRIIYSIKTKKNMKISTLIPKLKVLS